ncbi:glucosidase [Flexivirga endophytica]|uniref:Glucosidase n=1 Tax=Flexivirga endophytica TaxID=1849103 RepID=A0A916SUP6_9MICO|nr:glucosidase [Flexivirga endophytica]GGB17596.1 glucosidase [Flexivirga endophytica]GHB38039.1 glucosidase [Flexivirga endophytica]
MTSPADTAEHDRIAASPGADDPWRLWGPYVSARQWGTVREDYSADGNAWDYLPFDQAHRRAYRWGEDGMAAVCDRFGFLNLGVALWNGKDDRLKERLFGLTNAQGNHGEDVKEVWWPTDATPTHSYASWLYRYPQAPFPYGELVAANAARGKADPEFELTDTEAFTEDRFFDVAVTYAKESPTDLLMQVDVTNHGPDPSTVHLVPQAWFRNTWAYGRDDRTPSMQLVDGQVRITHDWLGTYRLEAMEGCRSRHTSAGAPVTSPARARILFCDNETDNVGLFGSEARTDCPTNGIDRAIVHGDESATRADHGTKVAFWWQLDDIAPGETRTVGLRLGAIAPGAGRTSAPFDTPAFGGFADFDDVLRQRRAEADDFYRGVIPATATEEEALIARRAFAGLMWGKQLYRYGVGEWLEGDPTGPPPPPQRRQRGGRNIAWSHLDLADIISMPDEWEYPWFASWDLAFHTVPLALIDPAFAKDQIDLMVREWAQHPNGQLPAYEWNFDDVNPPVHAWAAWQVYSLAGDEDREFLARVYSKLLMNFSWWVNRKDADDSYLFEGGFLGMDNIGPFDRSQPLPDGMRLEQSDATSWMAFYSLSMLRIGVELAHHERSWSASVRTFFEYFLRLARAMTDFGSNGISLWDEDDGFYYDAIVRPDGSSERLPVRSLVGLLPLAAVESVHPVIARQLPDLLSEVHWLERRDTGLADVLAHHEHHDDNRITLSLVPPERRGRLLARMLDEGEFLSPYGIRSLSAAYRTPLTVDVDGADFTVGYTPAESDSALFGGNSNWRGPVWFPINFLLVDALATYADAYPDERVEHPTGSGVQHTLAEVTTDVMDRLVRLFRADANGRRPGTPKWYPSGPLWDGHPTFSEYFHGDDGSGLGATHQTGWTALVAYLICRGTAPSD